MVVKHIVNCESPSWVYNKYTHEKVFANCGKCSACLNAKHLRHVNLMEEQKKHSKYAYFCTLTYDDFEVPKLFFTSDRKALFNKQDNLFVDIPDDLDKPSLDWISKKRYIEYPRYKDFQDFMKRFRINVQRMMPLEECLKQHKKYGKYETILYYGSSELGPSTIRPHFHCIIFFNSEWLANSFGKVFYKSWSSFNRNSRRRHCKGFRSEFRPSDGKDFSYTAAYCDGNTDLPGIFRTSPLKPRYSFSKRPLLGYGQATQDEISQLFFTGAIRRYNGVDKNNQPVLLRFPKSFENKLFPKCPGFSRLDDAGRMLSYRLPYEIAGSSEGYSYKEFCKALGSREVRSWIDRYIRFSHLIHESSRCKLPYYSYWIAHRLFSENCERFGVSPGYYRKLIEDYYSLKEYYRLRDYYEYMETLEDPLEVERCYSTFEDLRFYPGSPSSHFTDSSDYKSMVYNSNLINREGMKSKKNRDYQLRGNAVVYNP